MAEKTTAERGLFKEEISTALYKNPLIINLLLGDTSGLTAQQIREKFKEHVFSHLFIDDTIEDRESFIFYDVYFPSLRPQVKDCRVVMFAICHRDILDNYVLDGYSGNRADILTQLIEDTLVNDTQVARSFGIGELALERLDIYNASRFYGVELSFNIPNFR